MYSVGCEGETVEHMIGNKLGAQDLRESVDEVKMGDGLDKNKKDKTKIMERTMTKYA